MEISKTIRKKRPRYPMPVFIWDALLERGLMEKYHGRPPYQQNDYIGWIILAKYKETQEKRLAQMLDELDLGDKYMNMPYNPKRLSR